MLSLIDDIQCQVKLKSNPHAVANLLQCGVVSRNRLRARAPTRNLPSWQKPSVTLPASAFSESYLKRKQGFAAKLSVSCL